MEPKIETSEEEGAHYVQTCIRTCGALWELFFAQAATVSCLACTRRMGIGVDAAAAARLYPPCPPLLLSSSHGVSVCVADVVMCVEDVGVVVCVEDAGVVVVCVEDVGMVVCAVEEEVCAVDEDEGLVCVEEEGVAELECAIDEDDEGCALEEEVLGRADDEELLG